MKAGDYLVEKLSFVDVEPKIWEVLSVQRGKVRMNQVEPTNLTRMIGRERRMDLVNARKLHAFDPNDLSLVKAIRELRAQRVRIREQIEAMPMAT